MLLNAAPHLPGSAKPVPLRRGAASERGRRTNLTAQLTSFVGHSGDVEELLGLLGGSPPAARLVTLTGAGGVGKTRIALEAAARLLAGPSLADGAWLVDLATLGKASDVPRAAASVFGLHEEAGRSVEEVLVDALGQRRLLLVLDNCEHLVLACAELADSLLRSCPHLALLATSREPLGILGETIREVRSLGRPDLRALPRLETLHEYDAVRLFCERAQAAAAHFRLTHHTAVHVAQVCDRLEGIPLALELAAARLRGLSIEQIASRLDDSLHVLGAGSRVAPARQRTLEAVVAWSYDLLGEDERRLFERLAVFVGGWTLEAAETICADEASTLDLLARLIDKSLVVVEDDATGGRRYRYLEPIRQFALDRLRATGDEHALRERHLTWYLRFALPFEDDLRRRPLPWSARARRLEHVRAEFPNLRVAWQWTRLADGRNQRGLTLAAALFGYFYLVGNGTEGREWLVASLAQDRNAAPTMARAQALSAAAKLAAHLADDAVPLAREFLALPDHVRPRAETGLVYAALGITALRTGDLASARTQISAALAESRVGSDDQSVALQLGYLASVAIAEGELDHAQNLWEQAATLGAAIDFPTAEGIALGGLAHLLATRDETAAARDLYHRALARMHDQGMPQLVALLVALGDLELRESQLGPAQACFASALEVASALGHREAHVAALEGVAVLTTVAAGGAGDDPGQRFDVLRLLGATARMRQASRLGAAAPAVGRTLECVCDAVGRRQADALRDEGSNLTLEQAIMLARSLLDSVSRRDRASAPPTARTAQRVGGLTERQVEVARLVADGKTNREIAAALVLSERTVTKHLDHIFAKLSVSSRTAVAAFALRHGLA